MHKQNLAVVHVEVQLVISLSISRQQVVFALPVPSCEQGLNNLLTTRNKLDGDVRLVSRLSEQRNKPLVTRLSQSWQHKAVTILLYHHSISLVGTTL